MQTTACTSGQLPLHPVDEIVAAQHVLPAGHLRVQGEHQAAGPVIVHNQIVHPDDAVVGKDIRPDRLHHFGIGRPAPRSTETVSRTTEKPDQRTKNATTMPT